jgi:hypothetical protein
MQAMTDASVDPQPGRGSVHGRQQLRRCQHAAVQHPSDLIPGGVESGAVGIVAAYDDWAQKSLSPGGPGRHDGDVDVIAELEEFG